MAEKIEGLAAEMAAQDAESPGAIAEAPGDLLRGEMLDKKGAQRLVLALSRRLGFQEESGCFC